MKIKRLYVLHSITSINSQTSFDSSRHTIKYVKEVNCYLVDDKVLIPSSSVCEILLDLTPEAPTPKSK